MRYALWNLAISDANYQTGPEDAINLAGGQVEPSWSNGSTEKNADILGYIVKDFSADLSAWNFREITQQEALDFCLSIDPKAYLMPDGKIGVLEQEV
jgi:hypothetical protein